MELPLLLFLSLNSSMTDRLTPPRPSRVEVDDSELDLALIMGLAVKTGVLAAEDVAEVVDTDTAAIIRLGGSGVLAAEDVRLRPRAIMALGAADCSWSEDDEAVTIELLLLLLEVKEIFL